MNVFEFNFEVEYGGGVMLIAATTRERAKEIVRNNYPSRPFCGYWEWASDRPDLTFNGPEGAEILSYTRVE